MSRMPFSILPVSAWPPEDAERWARARRPRKLFAERTAGNWRPATIEKTEKSYGLYLKWLAVRGYLDDTLPMDQRVNADLIEEFAREYGEGRAPLTLAGRIRDVAQMLRACFPPAGLPWLSKLGFDLMNAAKPVRPKLPHIASPDELLDLAELLMERGQAERGEGKSSGARAYRDGLIIACLTTRPLRLGEFMSLRLDHTLVRRGDRWHFDIPPSSSKTKRRRRESFPVFLTKAIDTYVEEVRAELPAHPQIPDGGWFWLGIDGPLKPASMSAIVTRRTREGLGKAVCPHRFRDSAATAVALNIPEKVGITKSILGHSSLKSSQDHYNQARSYTASAELAEMLRKLRKTG